MNYKRNTIDILEDSAEEPITLLDSAGALLFGGESHIYHRTLTSTFFLRIRRIDERKKKADRCA